MKAVAQWSLWSLCYVSCSSNSTTKIRLLCYSSTITWPKKIKKCIDDFSDELELEEKNVHNTHTCFSFIPLLASFKTQEHETDTFWHLSKILFSKTDVLEASYNQADARTLLGHFQIVYSVLLQHYQVIFRCYCLQGNLKLHLFYEYSQVINISAGPNQNSRHS